MKKKQIIIGIDVSKVTLDCFIHLMDIGSAGQHFIVENSSKGFVQLLETAIKSTKCKKEDLLICFENTGKYSKMLSVFLSMQNILFVMAPALEIKKSLGITRGKNDKVDARRIALYAYQKKESLVPTVLPGEKIDRIKSLLSLREKLVKHRTAYKNGLSDLNDCYQEGETKIIIDVQQKLIKVLNVEIETVEEEIETIIKQTPLMKKNFELILSVRGIGKIVGFYLIAYTANFTSFVDARSFACYCGIAPFANSSGTVIGKARVHPYANRQMKSLLNMAAMSAIQLSGEYRIFYRKRVDSGKNKMSTINIIRNKLLFRVFAVIKRGTPYIDLFKFVA
jgi:transposase